MAPYVLDALYRELLANGWSAHRVRRIQELDWGCFRQRAIPFRWADIGTGRVVIRRSVSHTPASGLVVTEGKTGRKGHRSIGLGPWIVKLLVCYRHEQTVVAADHGLPEPRWPTATTRE